VQKLSFEQNSFSSKAVLRFCKIIIVERSEGLLHYYSPKTGKPYRIQGLIALSRPTDVLIMPNGDLYVTDQTAPLDKAILPKKKDNFNLL
jgi:hypothetical protein